MKKKNTKGKGLTKHHLRNFLCVFINCLIENPAFDAQTKVLIIDIYLRYILCPTTDRHGAPSVPHRAVAPPARLMHVSNGTLFGMAKALAAGPHKT